MENVIQRAVELVPESGGDDHSMAILWMFIGVIFTIQVLKEAVFPLVNYIIAKKQGRPVNGDASNAIVAFRIVTGKHQ